ncbi:MULTISPECIES: thioredoxin family protein [unclassified Rathayibacter]|uniref:thioredoxin family protein n=1 Tax=unclassified Rathayibacter TaxID=2609250 RepID=UPI00188BC411|nr:MULTISPECIES: thioredoxin family protein [unclassified Rathayibacter]MBF4463564.1 thioredoxin family protein [Rathayibacter sp. VKM Ac-2879]MBF4504986.1 thioredoxin family protein [Rathayibacter sp. VKM Ac-2878]
MDPLLIVGALLALVALGTLLGLLHRRAAGRVAPRPSNDSARIDPAELVDGATLGADATVLQFSTAFCTRCPAVHRMLAGVAQERPGVVHLDVDLTHRLDLAERFRIRQTPTLLVLDARGVPRSRIAGAPARAVLTEELDRLQEIR